MSLDAVSKQYRMITGQDSPTDAKQTKAATEPAAPGPELEVPVEIHDAGGHEKMVGLTTEPVAEVVDEDGAPLEETPAEPEDASA